MKLYLLLLLAGVSTIHAYHIFVFSSVPQHSHNQLGKGIVDALLQNGHEVTWVTVYPEKVKKPHKNLHIVDIKELQILKHDMTDQRNIERGLAFVREFSDNITYMAMASSAVQETIVKGRFDAVVTEMFFNDVMAGVAAVMQVPWILLSPLLMPNIEAQVDEVRSITTVPHISNDPTIPMSFRGRVFNLYVHLAFSFSEWWKRSAVNAMYEKIFSPLAAARNVPLPPLEEAYHNVSVLLVNAHEALTPALSLPPNVVNIAGFHIDDVIPDLQDLLDKSKEGVIYFSMGSVVRSAALKEETRKALLAKFAKLPYTVLWKFEEKLEGLPPNVHVRPWLPQTSVLAHPNIKVFITHGGQLSCLEAVHAGVPLLAVPVFGDQPPNAERAMKSGYAQMVPFGDDMADGIDEKLRVMLSNPAYTQRVKYLSKLFRGRPVPPKKLISHYIELAIETKGAYHLRSVSLQYSWIERWMLDQVAVVLGALLLVLLLLRAVCKKICGKRCSQAESNKQSRKKRN